MTLRAQPPLKERQGPKLDDAISEVNNGGCMDPHCFHGGKLNPRVRVEPTYNPYTR